MEWEVWLEKGKKTDRAKKIIHDAVTVPDIHASEIRHVDGTVDREPPVSDEDIKTHHAEKKKPRMFPTITREFVDDAEDKEYKNAAWEAWLEKDAMDGKQGGSPKDEEPKRDYLKEFHDEIKRIKAAGKKDPEHLAYKKDQKENTSKRMQQHLDSNNLINNYSKRLNTNVRNPKHVIGQKRTLDDLGDETNVELGNVKDYAMGNEGYYKKSWESWLEKVDEPPTKITIFDIKEDDSFEEKQRKLHQLSNYNDSQDMNEGVTTVGGNIDQQRVHKLLKNNATETSHKDGEKKVEWDGKFSSSTIEDEVKNEDEKSESEEESLEELTDGDLVEIEKLKSWELWLEKDALDGKGGNEAKGDLRQPSFWGMWTKPTRQTKEGQARDYIPDTPHVDSYHSRRLGHGEKYESGRRPLETEPKSGGHINEKREEEWDITADQDASKRGSGKNTYDDPDDVEPSGGFIHSTGRQTPPTGNSPNIKPQGKGVKHRGRPRGSKNKAWENWLEKKSRFKPSNPLHRNIHPHNIPIKDDPYYKNVDLSVDYSQTADARAGDDEYDAIRREKIRREGYHKKSWEGWLDKGKWDKFERDVDNSNRAVAVNQKENENRDGKVDDREIHSDLTDLILEGARDVHRPSTGVMDPNFTTKKPRYHKGVEQEGDDIADEYDHLNIEIADSMKSWEAWLEKGRWDNKPKPKTSVFDAVEIDLEEDKGRTTRIEEDEIDSGVYQPSRLTAEPEFGAKGKKSLNIHNAHLGKSWEGWLEKMQGAGDARFGNQHLTGLDQKPVNNEEDEANILPEKDEKTDDKEEKQEKTDNKPYKALGEE